MTLKEIPEVEECIERAITAMRDASESMAEFEEPGAMQAATDMILESIYELDRYIGNEKKRLREIVKVQP